MSKVLHPSQLPSRLPFLSTFVAYLGMDFYDAPGWVWGMGWTLLAILWFGASYAIYKQEHTKIRELDSTE